MPSLFCHVRGVAAMLFVLSSGLVGCGVEQSSRGEEDALHSITQALPCEECVAAEPPPEPLFNNGFDERDFPYTGSCSCALDANSKPVLSCTPAMTTGTCWGAKISNTACDVQCAGPTGIPYGWAVAPSDTFKSSKGNGDVLFVYGDGRNPGPPRSPGYVVPDGTALYFRSCNLSDPAWCYQTSHIGVASSNFPAAPGSVYRLSAWMRSSTAMLSGSNFRNGVSVRVRFYDSTGAELSATWATGPQAAPVDNWTEFGTSAMAPHTTAWANVEVLIERAHQSNVWVDDVRLTPVQ